MADYILDLNSTQINSALNYMNTILDQNINLQSVQTIEVSGQGFTGYADKWGKLVNLEILGGSAPSQLASGTITTLPEGWRPKHRQECVNTAGGERIMILTNGNIQNSDALPSGRYLRFSVTYLIP